MLIVMKNLISVLPLIVLRKSASGLAVQVCTEREAGLLALSNRHLPWVGAWLPLSQVVIKDRKVVAVAPWLIKAKQIPRLPAGEVGAW
jgi:hypothetical protein